MKQASLCHWLLACCCLCVPCRNAGAEPSDREAAQALFVAGRAALQAGDYAAACKQFHASDELEHGVGTWLNLGLCEERLGHWLSGSDYYRRVLEAALPDDPRALIAREQLAALDRRLPRLTLRLAPGAPSDTAVSQGLEQGATYFGRAIASDPGVRHFTVVASGFAPRDYDVSLAEGQEVELAIAPGAPLAPLKTETRSDSPSARSSEGASAAVPTERPAVPGSQGSSRALGWTLVAAGGAALAVGATTELMLLHDQSVVKDECDASKSCSSTRALDAAAQGRRLNLMSPVTSIAGILLAGAGVYVLSRNPRQSATTRVGAWVSQSAGELDVVHTF